MAQPFSVMLGTKLPAFDVDHAAMAVPIGANVRQHLEIANSGLIAFLADAAVTFAAGSVGGGEKVRTVDLTINYRAWRTARRLLPGPDVLHRGSLLMVAATCSTARGTRRSVVRRLKGPSRRRDG